MGDKSTSRGLYFRDSRVHSWRWQPILEKWGHLRVFVDPKVLKTATFLIVNGEPDSTVLFVGVSLWNPRVPVGYEHYAVTTKHSVKNKDVFIRFNLKGGGMHDQPTNPHDWIPHPDTDLALLPIKFPIDDFDVGFVWDYEVSKEKDFLITYGTEDKKQSLFRYGMGDEVFTVGLFEGHYGENIAQPGVRFGHIALKPAQGEKIVAEMESGKYVPIDAFLIEVAAMKGQSGSPVFLRPWVEDTREEQRPMTEYNFLIGMIQGFYPAKQDAQIEGKNAEISVNIGLGIVIPSQYIVEMLMEGSLVKQREERLQKIRDEAEKSKIKPSMASISKTSNSNGPPLTSEAFEDALKRASRKISQPESGSDET